MVLRDGQPLEVMFGWRRAIEIGQGVALETLERRALVIDVEAETARRTGPLRHAARAGAQRFGAARFAAEDPVFERRILGEPGEIEPGTNDVLPCGHRRPRSEREQCLDRAAL